MSVNHLVMKASLKGKLAENEVKNHSWSLDRYSRFVIISSIGGKTLMIIMNSSDEMRCPHCDTLNKVGDERCFGCGRVLSPSPEKKRDDGVAPVAAKNKPLLSPNSAVTKKSAEFSFSRFNLLALCLALLLLLLAWQTWRNETKLALAFRPTATPSPIIPTATLFIIPTATPTPTPTATPLPTETPTPLPTATVQPPKEHIIASGDALFNLGLRYGVSVESILGVNPNVSAQSIVVGQTLLIPYPTATPPLQPVEIKLNGETVIADPTDCLIHEFQEGDNYFAVARRYEITLEALLAANRLQESAVVQPGDTVCIPKMVYLVSQTLTHYAREDRPIVQPRSLYPTEDSLLTTTTPILLRWLAERDLTENEWYMVEVTNLTDFNQRPHRAFTRQTSLKLPAEWIGAESADYRWRLTFVTLTPSDKADVWTYQPRGSAEQHQFTITTP